MAVRDHDRVDGVALAVAVLTPPAAFEAVGTPPQIAQHAERVRRPVGDLGRRADRGPEGADRAG